MAAVTYLLLVVLICGLNGEKIKVKGDIYTFQPPMEANFCVISRSIGEENLLLWNTSDPSPENSTLPEDLKRRLKVRNLLLWNTSDPSPENPTLPEDLKKRLEVKKNISSYEIHNLTHSDSGLYRQECWTDGNVTHQWNTSITVCSTTEHHSELRFHALSTMDIPCKTEGVTVGDDLTVQWFIISFEDDDVWTRMFSDDTMKQLEGRVQLVENSSSLRISNLTRSFHVDDQLAGYACLVMEKQQCVSSNTKYVYSYTEYGLHSVGEKLVLPCFNTDLYGPPAFWMRRDAKVFSPPPSQNHSEGFGNLTDQEQQYGIDPVVNGNFSLVFSSLMINHTDVYYCINGGYSYSYVLLVCPESDPLTQFFSDGEVVTLSCNSSGIEFGLFFWVRKTEQKKSVLYYPTQSSVMNTENPAFYEGLKDRLNVSSSGTAMVLSNLSPEDSGEYWCVSSVNLVCKSAARTILIYKDPFGINSTFYAVWASLMTCGLLGMVCAVVTVNVMLKTRRGEQVPVI